MVTYELTQEHEDRVLEYMRRQAKEHGTTTFDPTNDSFLAYVKHDWNEQGLGSFNCETVQAPLWEVMGRLKQQGLVERVGSSYMIKEVL